MKYFYETVKRTLELTQSSADGLGQSEAELRLYRNGKNKLAEAKSKSFLRRFAEQLSDPMIIILIVAAVISAATAMYEGYVSGKAAFPTDTVIILAVVLINSLLGVLRGKQRPLSSVPCYTRDIRPLFLLLASSKSHARLAYSLVNALTTAHCRYQLFAVTKRWGVII